MTDPFDLDRFVTTQAGSYQTALAEIRRGAKRSHWMWYIFPQIAGLGRSDMARRYAIRPLGEARAYLAHPILGARLRECVAALQDLIGLTADGVFGNIDAVKLRSSLTLLIEAGAGALFTAALDRWFDGVKDSATWSTMAAAIKSCGQPSRSSAGRSMRWIASARGSQSSQSGAGLIK